MYVIDYESLESERKKPKNSSIYLVCQYFAALLPVDLNPSAFTPNDSNIKALPKDLQQKHFSKSNNKSK